MKSSKQVQLVVFQDRCKVTLLCVTDMVGMYSDGKTGEKYIERTVKKYRAIYISTVER